MWQVRQRMWAGEGWKVVNRHVVEAPWKVFSGATLQAGLTDKDPSHRPLPGNQTEMAWIVAMQGTGCQELRESDQPGLSPVVTTERLPETSNCPAV